MVQIHSPRPLFSITYSKLLVFRLHRCRRFCRYMDPRVRAAIDKMRDEPVANLPSPRTVPPTSWVMVFMR